MKLIITLLLIPTLGFSFIHGNDDRIDVYQTKNPLHKKLADSTATMMKKGHMKNHGDYFEVTGRPLDFFLKKPQCSPDPYKDQMSISSCSGFLIAPDILVTAAHCISTKPLVDENDIGECKYVYWVFDYYATSDNSDLEHIIEYDEDYDYTEHFYKKRFSRDSVYTCEKILDIKFNDKHGSSDEYYDHAVIKLNRPVVGRDYLNYRKSHRAEEETPIISIGYPLGLPAKIATNATIIYDGHSKTYLTDLDVMQSNSGSAVMDAATGMVEGIVVKGLKLDYTLNPAKSCYEPYTIKESGYAYVYKITEIPYLQKLDL